MLDVRQLRALREVAARGSLSAAAEHLDYTQPAVSQQIAALEREVGMRLLERGKRPIGLTDAGAALVAHAEAVLSRLDDAEQELAELKGLRAGRLRMGSVPTAFATLVPRALAVFTERHPDVVISVVDDHLDGLIRRLASWEIDLAVIYRHEPLPEPDADLDLVHLFDEPFDVVLPPGHRFAGRRSLRLEELRDETWIGGTAASAYQRLVLHHCEQAGFEPRVAYGTQDYRAVLAFVANDLGVALLPRSALSWTPEGVATVALRRPPVRRIYAARLAKSFRSPAADTMVRVLVDEAAV